MDTVRGNCYLIQMSWIIYLLLRKDGDPFYVGGTRNLKRRLKEHKQTFGFKPLAIVLQEGHGGSWREAEVGWIAELKSRGYHLENKVSGGNGVYFLSAESRAKVSAASRGMKKPAGFGARISAVTKGVPHEWSDDGRLAASATQFKPGQGPNQTARDTTTKRHLEFWAGLSKDERSALMTKRNRLAWSKRTPEQRSAIGQKIAAARLRNAAAKKSSTEEAP